MTIKNRFTEEEIWLVKETKATMTGYLNDTLKMVTVKKNDISFNFLDPNLDAKYYQISE